MTGAATANQTTEHTAPNADETRASDEHPRARVFSPREHPRDSVNWRRHRTWCPHYRVRWYADDPKEPENAPLYQVFCLKDTPPTTADEQDKCFTSQTRCWRIAEAERARKALTARDPQPGADIPLTSVKRRLPATPRP